MRIAIFSDCYLDLTGGIITAINAEKAELERRGHTVYVFSSAYQKTADELKKLAKSHIYPVPSCKVFGRGLTPIARRPGIVEKWLLKNHPELKEFDIFYIHYEAGCSIAGLRLAKNLKKPSIQFMHGREDSGEEKLIPFGLRTIVATLLNWFHSWYLPHPDKIRRDNYLATTIARAKMWTMMINHANYADLVFTPSEHFRKKLLHYGVKREVIALHHAKDSITTPAEPITFKSNDTLEIIWHSRVSGEKRTIPFLKALLKVQGKYHVSMYGDGTDFKKAKRFVSRHRLNVTFYGKTPLSIIKKQLPKSHLDVLVSENSDTFGMTIIEAAEYAVPVFIVDPDLTEIATPGGYVLANSSSKQAMAEAINEIFKKPDIIEKASRAIIKKADQYDNTKKVEKLEQIMLSMLQ